MPAPNNTQSRPLSGQLSCSAPGVGLRHILLPTTKTMGRSNHKIVSPRPSGSSPDRTANQIRSTGKPPTAGPNPPIITTAVNKRSVRPRRKIPNNQNSQDQPKAIHKKTMPPRSFAYDQLFYCWPGLLEIAFIRSSL